MMASTLLKAMKASPATFRANLLIDVDGELRHYGQVLDDWQAQDFANVDPGWERAIGRRATGGYSRAFQVRPRGCSKTSDTGRQCEFATLAAPSKRKGYWLAGDQDQGEQVVDVWTTDLQRNPALRAELKVLGDRLVNTRTGSETVVISHQFETSFGLLPDWVVADEISWWPKPDLFYSLVSAVGKRKTALLACILNAGVQGGWAWNLRQTIRLDDDWYFSELPGCIASWITPEMLAEQERILPDFMFDRLWRNRWLAPGGLRIKADWLRSWRFGHMGASYELLGPDGAVASRAYLGECSRAMFVDPAGTSAEVAEEKRGRTPSWSVVLTVDYTPARQIVIVDVLRVRCEIPELIDRVMERSFTLKPAYVGCENSGIGLAAYQLLNSRNLYVRALEPGGKDKATRFAPAQVLLQQGKVFLPESAPWLDDFKSELLSWTGHPRDVFDQGDVLGYAGLSLPAEQVEEMMPADGLRMGRLDGSADFCPPGYVRGRVRDLLWNLITE